MLRSWARPPVKWAIMITSVREPEKLPKLPPKSSGRPSRLSVPTMRMFRIPASTGWSDWSSLSGIFSIFESVHIRKPMAAKHRKDGQDEQPEDSACARAVCVWAVRARRALGAFG